MPAARDSSTSAGISSSVGCGGSAPPSPARSTPITSRRSRSASWAVARITPAASRSPPAARPGGTPARPRARTAATAGGRARRASRPRSAAARPRARPPRGARCSASRRSRALVRGAQQVALRAREQPPRDDDRAGSASASSDVEPRVARRVGVDRGEDRRPPATASAVQTTIARREPRSATLNSAISAGPAANAENALGTTVISATANGYRRRHHSGMKHSAADHEVEERHRRPSAAPRSRRARARRPHRDRTIVPSTIQSRGVRLRPAPAGARPGASMSCPSPAQRTPEGGAHPLPKSIPPSTRGRFRERATRRCSEP